MARVESECTHRGSRSPPGAMHDIYEHRAALEEMQRPIRLRRE